MLKITEIMFPCSTTVYYFSTIEIGYYLDDLYMKDIADPEQSIMATALCRYQHLK